MEVKFLKKKKDNNVKLINIFLGRNESFSLQDVIELRKKFKFAEILKFSLILDEKREEILKEVFEEDEKKILKLEEMLRDVLKGKNREKEIKEIILKQIKKNNRIFKKLKIEVSPQSQFLTRGEIKEFKYLETPKLNLKNKFRAFNFTEEEIKEMKSFSRLTFLKEQKNSEMRKFYCYEIPFKNFAGAKVRMFSYNPQNFQFFKLFNHFCEPFAGSGVISYIMFKFNSNTKSLLNDKNTLVFLRHKFFLEHPKIFNLISFFHFLPPINSKLRLLVSKFRKITPLSIFLLFEKFFMVQGSLDLRITRFPALRTNMNLHPNILKNNFKVFNLDFEEFILKNLNFIKKNKVLVFFDPPYYTFSYFRDKRKKEAEKTVEDILKRLKNLMKKLNKEKVFFLTSIFFDNYIDLPKIEFKGMNCRNRTFSDFLYFSETAFKLWKEKIEMTKKKKLKQIKLKI